ncbi:centrosome-associated protein ALMS1 isoform X2 [Myxocyprinus asiaticus]|uniref:centrosome-associated protein ALMS1 isoform X2 n=1 Tax=Myxocyprinus asiaticus TaxID=70543 RepID=UPI0022218AF1|nr:centrosome-associated protein ALMS1 isoform X2 [Myxocyprinus asiaticus]
MESEGHAADVNKTPAENPCEQQGQHMHGSEGFRQHTNPDDFSRPFSNTQDSSALINRPETLQLEFQDSQLSPALTLLPCLDKPHTLSDSTFLQHTDAEFVPLRGFPDLSVISERCARMSHVGTAGNSHLHDTIHDQATLSQHPLEVPEALSEVESSCCSLSQHRLSPDNHCKAIKDGESVSCGSENKIDRHMEGEEQSAAQWRSKGVSARSLLVFGEEDVGVAVSSSNAVSSSSKTALNQLEAISDQQNTAKTQLELSMNVQTDREQPQGGSLSSSFQKTTGSTVGADVSNITFRESRMHLHQTSQSLCDQLLCVGERGSISVPSSRPQSGNKSSNSGLYVAPASGGVMHVPGQQRVLWSSGNQTAADDSFLNSHPVSQSTPAVLLMRPPPSLTKLSLIDSQQESVATEAASSQNSHLKTGLIPSLDLNTVDQHSSPICPQTTVTVPSGPSLCSGTAHKFLHVHPVSYEQETPPVFSPHVPDAPCSDRPSLYSGTEMKDHVSRLALGRVQSLPSLNYLQKVDAWKASQNSSSSFYDGVSPKKKAQDAVSETLNSMLSRDMHQASGANASSQMTPPPLSSSHSGSVSPSRVDVVGAGVGRGQAVESSVNRSHSHSSLSSVVTSIQRDMGTHIGQVLVGQTDDVIPTTRSLGNQSSLLSGGRSGGVNSSAIHMEKSSVKLSPLISLVHFSDVSSSLNMSSTLSSSQGSYHGEQSMRASVGAASSVVSLEVDNYAPYWTSGHASPSHTRELNIEDRIPMYLLNLGIDQSPSTILNPFTRRGPIREPEFSPTDLCTIKGSIGTPTKSTQPSEVDSLQKETFSSSSQLSADSIASVTHHLSVHEQGQPASQRSERTIFSQTDTPPGLTLHPSSGLQQSDAPQHEGCLPIQLSPESMPAPPGPRVEVKEDDDSLVASGTLHEIRHLLGCAESLVSGRSSLTSSPGSHRLSESDTSLVSLGRNSRVYDDTSLSTGGKFSLLLTRSSSDSALKGSSSSSQGQQRISIQTDRTTTELAALSLSREGSLKSHDLCVTPRRAEPEGCSAADPDKAKPPTALSVMQMNVPSGAGNLPQNQEQTENAVLGSSETSLSNVSAEVGSLSDSSSESSLAARVAKLLQSESPVSMVTSRPSTADSEDSRAREWILMKVSGRRCESLELNAEDRARIEDIKRELLLDTKHTKSSSDSEGSAQSSVGVGSQPVKDFFGEHNISEQPQKAGQKPLDSSVLFHMLLQQDLEAKVHQIALREGFSPPPLTSISIATTRRTQSPQLPSHYPVKGTVDLGHVDPGHETLQHDSHQRETDNNLVVTDLQQKHQPTIFLNVSDRKKEMEGEGEHREEKEREESADENRDNAVTNDPQIVQRMAHMDYIATDINQSLSSTVSGTNNKSHLPHLHVTISPKQQSSSIKYQSSRTSCQNTFKDVQPPRHSPMMPSTADVQFPSTYPTVTSNQASSFEHREPAQGQNAGTVSAHLQARYPQTLTPSQRLAGTSRTLSVQAAAVPTLLPYKPHGSSKLFYMQQAYPELSPDCSDTTVESSHPGSDDAVPPRFNIEILGSRELEDNIITPKHKEGIYSKRANMKRVSSNVSGSGLPESVVSVTGRYDSTALEVSDVSEKDMEFSCIDQEYEDEDKNFVPLHMEADYSTHGVHLHSSTMQEPKLPPESHHLPSQTIRKSYRVNTKGQERSPHDVSMEISSSLDQLWRRFSEKWSMEETRPSSERDTSLLDRLERLSRLIHNTTPTQKPIKQPDSRSREYERSDHQEGKTEEGEKRERMQLPVAPKQAWAEQEENQENVHRCPAERDESASVSMETSSSLSTIDTERLLRAFGPQRVTSKGLKSNDSLLKLYNTINKQKTGRRKPSSKHAAVSINMENVSTDDSTVSADSLSSSSTFSLPSQRGVSHSHTTKRSKVKLVSKGVQAGDLEIVMNGTRRHTRDVGTIFPSPGAFRSVHWPDTLSSGVHGGITIPTASTANPTQTPAALKRDTCNKGIRNHYPNGVSWFVSADELKSDGPKENQVESAPSQSQAWFEAYSRSRPWREPVREPLRERQIQVEQERPTESRTAIETDSCGKLSALVRLSLQEALELHRPEFVSRSRERMKRLGLLVEERRLQAVFDREREELFNCPRPTRPLRPAPVPRKQVVPRREMVQRSKDWVGKKAHTQRIGRTDRLRR